MTAFDEISKKAATAFLQTIVLVDNMATFLDRSSAAAEPASEPLTVPDEFASAEVTIDPIAQSVEPIGLDAGAVSHASARAGIVCSIIRPTASERLEDEVVLAGTRADILVLDWQMDDDGQLASSIITRLTNDDDAAGGRLRLIAIYTEQAPLTPIRDKLIANEPRLQSIQGAVAVEYKNLRVLFFTKGAISGFPGEENLAVAAEALPERLIEEFAKFAGGLLPNATLAAIAGLRQHTHRVLARFDKYLDGSLLTHRTLLPTPEDAEQFAADLILAELGAQVPIDRIVGEYLGGPSIRDYFDHRMAQGLTPALMLDSNGGQRYDLDLVKACTLVEQGLPGLAADIPAMAKAVGRDKEQGKFKNSLRDELYQLLYLLSDSDLDRSKANHARFAIRSKLKREATSVHADKPETHPKLRLGSLLESQGAFWICLTPYCDSARIPPAGGRFLFAQMTKSDSLFELVVPDRDDTHRLLVERKRTHLVTHVFSPNEDGDVRAVIGGEDAIFESLDAAPPGAHLKFRWLGELKSMHAVKFIQAFAGNMARVGLDDFEWHRAQSPRE